MDILFVQRSSDLLYVIIAYIMIQFIAIVFRFTFSANNVQDFSFIYSSDFLMLVCFLKIVFLIFQTQSIAGLMETNDAPKAH